MRALVLLLAGAALAASQNVSCTGPASGFFEQQALAQDGKNHSFAQYAGNV